MLIWENVLTTMYSWLKNRNLISAYYKRSFFYSMIYFLYFNKNEPKIQSKILTTIQSTKHSYRYKHRNEKIWYIPSLPLLRSGTLGNERRTYQFIVIIAHKATVRKVIITDIARILVRQTCISSVAFSLSPLNIDAYVYVNVNPIMRIKMVNLKTFIR